MNTTGTIPRILTTTEVGEFYLGRGGTDGRYAAWRMLKTLEAKGLKPIPGLSSKTQHYYRRSEIERFMQRA